MKYSIIIPTLNEERLLPALLEQLHSLKESVPDSIEIIISDGGSTDNTVGIALEKADKITVHTENAKQNIAQGRNTGAKIASGEIFIFLNGDIIIKDVLVFHHIIDSQFYAAKKYAAMTCSVEVIPKESKLIDKVFLTFYNHYFHTLNIIGMGMGRGECHIIRKEVFEKLGGYNENLAAGEDFEFFTRVRRKGKILFSKKIKIYESPRRYRKYGHFKILFMWLLNSIYVILLKKSLSNEWEEVR